MAGRGLPMAIYVVRIATRTVNGDGCHEAVGLKRVYHINSTDRMHHLFLLSENCLLIRKDRMRCGFPTPFEKITTKVII
jgi:hypothetical protein